MKRKKKKRFILNYVFYDFALKDGKAPDSYAMDGHHENWRSVIYLCSYMYVCINMSLLATCL